MFDVAVIGCGVIGAAAAFELSKYQASVVVLEKGSEAGAHILSGAVVDPIGIDRLLPGWREEEIIPSRRQLPRTISFCSGRLAPSGCRTFSCRR